MAYSGRSVDHYRFYRYSTLLMDVGGDTLRLVVKKFCQGNKLTFHEFLSKYKDDLFHGRKTQHKCTNCPHKPPLSTGGAFDDDQWKQLYIPDASYGSSEDVDSSSNSQHGIPQRWKVNPSVELEHLEINLIADILHNVRPVLLFYLHGFMRHYGQTNFESFLNHNRHVLYHHYIEDNCCLCSSHMKTNDNIKIFENQWKSLFRKSKVCTICSSQVCCAVFFAKSLQEDELSMNLFKKVLILTVPAFQIINSMLEKRHIIYAHPWNDTKMDEKTFNREWRVLSDLILELIKRIEQPELKDEWKNRIEDLSSSIPTDEEYNELLDKVGEMEKHEKSINQELIEMKQLQKKILSEVTRKRTDNMKLTKNRIQDHLKGLRVQTEYVEKGYTILQEYGILIYIGMSGEGKTWHCLEVLSTLTGKDVIQLDNMRLGIKDWDTYIGADLRDMVVWIDDLKAASIQNQKPFFERMQTHIEKGELKVIISITETELQRIQEPHFDIFKDCFIVSLGNESDRKKDFESKKKILYAFLRAERSSTHSFGTFFPKGIVNDIKENFDSEPFKISEKTIGRIAKIKTNIGFPECCRRFCSDPHLFKKGESFFKYPSETTKEQVTEMANSDNDNIRKKFLVLCLVLLFPFDIVAEFRSKDIPKCLLEILGVTLDKWSYQRALRGLIPSYLIKDACSKICFQHETIRLAVAITLCNLDKEAINYFAANGPIDIVLDLCRTELQKPNPCLPSTFRVSSCIIFHRLVKEMSNNSYRHSIKQIFWYLGTDNPALWTNFLEYVGENVSSEKRSLLEKMIKLNVSNPVEVFRREISQSKVHFVDITFMFRIAEVGILEFFLLIFFDLCEKRQDRHQTDLYLKLISFLTQNYGILLYIVGEGLKKNWLNILEDGSLYIASDIKKIIDSFGSSYLTIQCTTFLIHFILYRFGIRKSGSKARKLSLRLPFPIPFTDDKFYVFNETLLLERRLFGNVIERTSYEQSEPKFRVCVLRACEEKNVPLLKALRSVIMNNQEYKSKLLEKAYTPTDSSYSLTEVKRVCIEDKNIRTGVLKFMCKDINILEMLQASDEHLLALIKQRFLPTEFLFNHICSSFNFLKDTHISENECCIVEQCYSHAGLSKFQYLDCCVIMTEKDADHSRTPLTLFSICNYHFADFSFIEDYLDDSLEFLKAVDEIEKHRISTLSFFTGRLGKYIDEIFFEACYVGSHIMIRHILEEELDVMDETLTKGLNTASMKGHSLVVDKLLSWKPGLISQKCLSDCLQTTIENNHSQTMAYILTSEQVTSYLRDGSAKEDDILYRNIQEAIRKCDVKYLSRIFSLFDSKNIAIKKDSTY